MNPSAHHNGPNRSSRSRSARTVSTSNLVANVRQELNFQSSHASIFLYVGGIMFVPARNPQITTLGDCTVAACQPRSGIFGSNALRISSSP